MSETTQLVMSGKRMAVPRLFKRLVQVALAVAVTAAVFFLVIAGNGFLVGRSTFRAGFNAWLAFVRRPDILATMVLTAVVTVLLVYWQRDQERKGGGSGRPSL
jgi:membrane protease YdiL (CAAX protease family)